MAHTTLRAACRWSGFTDGEDYAEQWLGQPQGATQIERIHNRSAVWDFGPAGECVSFNLSMRSAFPDGVYGLVVGVGPTLAMLGTAETTIGGSGGPAGGPPHRGADHAQRRARVPAPPRCSRSSCTTDSSSSVKVGPSTAHTRTQAASSGGI